MFEAAADAIFHAVDHAFGSSADDPPPATSL
jgi:hypothetical protein